MFIVHKDRRVYFLSRDNTYREFESYDAFIKQRARLRSRQFFVNIFRMSWELPKISTKDLGQVIGNNWNDTYRCHDSDAYKRCGQLNTVDYILFDATWRVIHSEQIKKDLDNYCPKVYNHYTRYRKHEWLGFRNGPVPRTGHKKWRFSKYYRRPRTTQERRHYEPHKEYIRGKRRPPNLPTVWDDVPRGSNYSRSWKDCTKRRKQWMR